MSLAQTMCHLTSDFSFVSGEPSSFQGVVGSVIGLISRLAPPAVNLPVARVLADRMTANRNSSALSFR
jgi:hypothetical protein